MPSNYLVTGETSARRAVAPCYLEPPLRETWFIQYSGMFSDVPRIQDGLVFVGQSNGTLAAYDEVDHHIAWEYKRKGVLKLVHEGNLYYIGYDKRLHLIDSRSGQAREVYPFNRNGDMLVVQRKLVCTSYEGSTLMTGFDISTAKKVWNYRSKSGASFSMLCANEEHIIVGQASVTFGEGGHVVALNPENGDVVWEHSVSDLPLYMPGEEARRGAPGSARVHNDIVVVVVPKDFVVGLSVESGERLWTWTSDLSSAVSDAGNYLYRDRYYQLGANGSYHVIDPLSGKTIFETMLKPGLPKKQQTAWGWSPILVSETHLFVGSNDGHVLAFDRETGEYVWSILPKRGSAVRQFASANERLYYGDLGGRLHCLAPKGEVK